MFERLKSALSGSFKTGAPDAALVQWASDRALSLKPGPGGCWGMHGSLLNSPFRAERMASTRDYMKGLAVLAKADLGLACNGSVVVMNRVLKRTLEAQVNRLYSDVTDALQTTAKEVPEELRWLSMFRDAGWAGPDTRFWNRYAVLTDAPELARRWLDADAVAQLMAGVSLSDEATPVVLMLMRGKVYLRMATPEPGGDLAALRMLATFEHLSRRAVVLFGH